jgi:hypothetical protein
MTAQPFVQQGIIQPPKPKRKTSPLLIGCLALFALLFVVSFLAAIFSPHSDSSNSETLQHDSAVTDARNRATTKLLAMSDWSDHAAVARMCNQADRSRLTPPVKEHCAAAHLAEAWQRVKEGKAADARAAVNAAAAMGASTDDREGIEKPLKKAEAAEAKKQAADAKKRRELDAAAGAIARLAYGKALRQHYLDDNLDINVTVGGKNSDHITLEFALFNAVWANKFQKGDLLDEMKKLGFKRVDLTDNYNYHVYWDLK